MEDSTNSLAVFTNFDEESRKAVAGYHGVEPDDPGLLALMSLAHQWHLSPMSGEIWLREEKLAGENGNEGEVIRRPAIGRDGFLTIAHRSDQYLGMDCDVVCSKDTFYAERDGDEHRIVHVYRDIPTELGEEENAADYRGQILGAYAKVFLANRRPFYFFAPLKEYAQTYLGDDGKRHYKEAWTYTSSMILKSAQSYSLRMSLGVTGVVPVDEIRADDAPAPRPASTPAPPTLTPRDIIIEEGLTKEVEERLIEVVETENEQNPNSWGSSKVAVRLRGKGDEGAEAMIEEILEAQQVRADREARKAAQAEEPEEVEAAIVVEVRNLEPGQSVYLGPIDSKEGWSWHTVKRVQGKKQRSTVFTESGLSFKFPASYEVQVQPDAGE